MSVTHPTRTKIQELRKRWEGQERRLEAIARDLRAGRDWTIHLRGLPLVEEIPPLPGEAYGRDLRGADLQRLLRPPVEILPATPRQSGQIAAISLEGLQNNTALPGTSPFPVAVEGAAEIALAMRRGDRFLVARCDGESVGVVRLGERREFQEFAGRVAYLEISGLAVLPAWRRTGIGGRLLRSAETLALEDGYGWVLLRTTLEVGLVPWYGKHGYEERHTRQLTYPDAPTVLDVIMSKRTTLPTAQPGTPAAHRLRIVGDEEARRIAGGGSGLLVGFGGVATLR